MILIVIINVVRVFCTFGLFPLPSEKIDFFLGEGKVCTQAIADVVR